MPIFDTTPSKGSGGGQGGGTTYTAGNGIKIENDVISVNLSSVSDNATGIVNGKLYTPVNNLVAVKPLIIVQTRPATPDIEVTFTFGEEVITKRTDKEGKVQTEVSRLGVWSVVVDFGDKQIAKDLVINESKIYKTEALKFNIFGAKWNKTSATKWIRTDGAADFIDPNPALNNGTGSSPFDTIQPWAGMVRVEDKVAGTLVAIPKYYFKITDTPYEFGIQISPDYVEGFMVSPAHMDRGDGQGEKDVIYIGRYLCNSNYKSQTKSTKKLSVSRKSARSSIHNLGAEYWQFDYATWWTINMLYLVEYADWNCQKTIGYGCGSTSTTGYTDEMKYHTGTNKSSRNTYGLTQYRNIEGLWDNPMNWVDGVNRVDNKYYICTNPNKFSDDNNECYINSNLGFSSDGYISNMAQSKSKGLEWAICPNETKGTENTYIPDYAYTSGPCICTGGWNNEQCTGLFHYYTTSTGYSTSNYGSRLIKLPNKQ